MHKSIVLLFFTLLASLAFAQINELRIYNNDRSKSAKLHVPVGSRYCFCLKKTQTALIDGMSAGHVKLFSSSDCTGNWANGSEKYTNNAQWVNSVSFGRGGIESTWGGGRSCSHY